MRRKMVLGVGLAGILGGTAVGQFAGQATPAQPKAASPSGFAAAGQPVGTASPRPATPAGGYVAPVGGFQPAGGPANLGAVAPAALTQPPLPAVEIPSALGPNHPLALRPEHGQYFIHVKSYSRPHRPDPNDPGRSARELAESLADEVRRAHGVNVYLFEYISEEKKAEAAARAQALQRAAAFRASVEKYRQSSQLNGMEFLAPDNRIHYQTFRYRDQVAVLVGGFATEKEAVKFLAEVKKWPPPKDPLLMDGGAIVSQDPKTGQPMIEKSRLNPFPQATVIPNPTVPRAPAQAAPPGLDPFVVKLNEGRPYNLLKATKGWTLAVKSFSAPVLIQSKDEDSGMMRKASHSSGADALIAGAEQAEALAKALRDPRMKPCPFEAFVLHTRNGSIVTVGQFDGPTDPALLETRRILMGMTFNMTKDERGTMMTGAPQKLFGDNILPIPVPKP